MVGDEAKNIYSFYIVCNWIVGVYIHASAYLLQ